ncbi:hypothetical protein GCM10009775_36500 [Microbacterium aoyamense]|uniref:Uncharacterized protein n=1 Tax=Microbacterium aoyamense TaxID=344166 RepID=A0ABN2Q1Z5_9MICO|nr:hypothetical protein [Microbacterium aoyamense]
MTEAQDRTRQMIAVVVCWLPLAVLIVSVIASWDAVASTITTQWNAGEPATIAPAWTALLLPAGVCIIAGIAATSAAIDGTNRGRRIAYLAAFGAGCAALWVWFSLLAANDSGDAPHRLLLFPFFVLLGFIPWAIAGRGIPSARTDQVA